ncbi:hypothetical protein [Tellurirhabdus rosea]|uniref:hypothetical protein n=1 Tax=Tellurirhabdus rosea TaxID=2674997 RepID=UPI0022534FC9|nr:hypothetical protein [Tellurirhabdus rosea]
MSNTNKQSENERHSSNEPHLVSINEDNVTPEGADDNSMGEQSYGEDFMGKSHKRRSEEKND